MWISAEMLAKYNRIKKGGEIMEYYFCSRCGQGPFTWHGGTDIRLDDRKFIRICPECKKSFKAWLKLGAFKEKEEADKCAKES